MASGEGRQPPQDVLDALEAAVQDDRVLDMIVGYTRKLLLRLGFSSEDADVTELVWDAVSDTATGVRTYNPNAVAASTHIIGVVRNRVRDRLNRENIARMVPLVEEGKTGGVPKPPSTEDAEKLVERRDLIRRGLEALTKMAKESDDGEVLDLLAAFELGITRRADLAEATGMSVQGVTNAKKRLERMVDKLPQQLRSDVQASL